jgi:TrmH family RNA methyltransferase
MVQTENAEFQIIRALKISRTKRAGRGEIFIEGTESIKMAVKAKLEITRVIVAASAAGLPARGAAAAGPQGLGQEKLWPGLSQWARDLIRDTPGARVLELADPLYDQLCDRASPPEMLVTARRKSLSLEDLALPDNPFILLFDRPSDLGNLGSVIRSLNALGGDALLILGHGVDVYDPKVIRSSLGSVFFTPVVTLRSNGELGGFIAEQKKRNGLTVWGTDSKGAVPLGSARLRRPLLLVIGNEAKGMSAALTQLCDGIVSIPLTGNVNSLNVACAASICMWEAGPGSAGSPG